MAQQGTRTTALTFGGYEIKVAMSKARRSRDLETELVDADGKKISGGGYGGGGRRKPDVEAGESRAVRISEKHVIRLPQAELEEIEKRSKDDHATMQVLETIDYRQVPTHRIVEAYWLQPAQGTARGLRLLAEGLRDTGRVAIVKWVSTSREKLGVIRVRGERGRLALLLSELVFANDFAEADGDALSINDVEVDEKAIAAAAALVRTFARNGEAKVDTATDTAVDARLALYQRVQEEQMDDELAAALAEKAIA